jgi:hypothetical protein
MFITVLTRVRHWYLSWARLVQSILPHPVRSIVILASHLCLDLACGRFHSGFPTFLFSCTHAAFPAPLILLDLIIQIIFSDEYMLQSSSLCSFLHPPIISSLFSPNILHSTLFPIPSIYCDVLRHGRVRCLQVILTRTCRVSGYTRQVIEVDASWTTMLYLDSANNSYNAYNSYTTRHL